MKNKLEKFLLKVLLKLGLPLLIIFTVVEYAGRQGYLIVHIVTPACCCDNNLQPLKPTNSQHINSITENYN